MIAVSSIIVDFVLAHIYYNVPLLFVNRPIGKWTLTVCSTASVWHYYISNLNFISLSPFVLLDISAEGDEEHYTSFL